MNDDRKIIKPIRIMNGPCKNKEVEPFQPVQMNIYQSNTCRKEICWLHFDNKPRVQEKQHKSTSRDRQRYSMQGCMVDLKK